MKSALNPPLVRCAAWRNALLLPMLVCVLAACGGGDGGDGGDGGRGGGGGGGGGGGIADDGQQFAKGEIIATDNPMDLAINGDGFFQVGDGILPPRFTRIGEFRIVQGREGDSDKGFIVDYNGLYLLGIPAGQTTPGRLVVPTWRMPPQATTAITLELNLQSDVQVRSSTTAPINTVADLTNDGVDRTIDYTTSQILFDGKGQKVAVTYFFRKLEADPAPSAGERDSWAVYITANGTAVPTPPDGDLLQPAFIVRFDRTNGSNPDFLNPADLSAGPTAQPLPLWIPSTVDPMTGAVVEPIIDVQLNMAGLTQYASPFGVTMLTQNGFPSGVLEELTIESNGQITARYSNGQSAPAGQVQLASFINLRGLKPMRGNLWANTAESGAPTTHSPSEGGTGDLLQGSLEIPPST